MCICRGYGCAASKDPLEAVEVLVVGWMSGVLTVHVCEYVRILQVHLSFFDSANNGSNNEILVMTGSWMDASHRLHWK